MKHDITKKIDSFLSEAMGFVQKLPYQQNKKQKDIERNVNEPKDIMKAVELYIKGVQKIHDEDYKRNYKNLTPPNIIFKKGGRYIKVIRKDVSGTSASVHSFIDTKEGPEFGNVYKAASYKAPAKGARGNVFSPQNGLEAISKHGGGVWYAKSGRR